MIDKVAEYGRIVKLGQAGEHKSRRIIFTIPKSWELASSDTIYVEFKAPCARFAIPYDVAVDSEKGLAFWEVPSSATIPGTGTLQLTYHVEDESSIGEDVPATIHKSVEYTTKCRKSANFLIPDPIKSTWLDEVLHMIFLYLTNSLYKAGDNITIDSNHVISATGGGGGTTNYEALDNKPKINNKTLSGNISLETLGVQPAGNYVVDSAYNHTDNNYTNEEKTKLENIDDNAEENVQSDWDETDTASDAFIKNKPTVPTKTSDLDNDSNFISDNNYVHTDNNFTTTEKNQIGTNKSAIQGLQNNKVDKETGKGLSTNDFTSNDKNKLDGIEAGAKANVQSDWNVTDSNSDAFIKNKPTIPQKTSQLTNDSKFIADADYVHTDNNFDNTYKTKVDNAISKITIAKRLYGVDGSGNQIAVEIGEGLELDGNTIKAVGGSGSRVPAVGETFMLAIPDDPYDVFGEGSYEQHINKFLRAGTNTAVGGADQWIMTESQLKRHNHGWHFMTEGAQAVYEDSNPSGIGFNWEQFVYTNVKYASFNGSPISMSGPAGIGTNQIGEVTIAQVGQNASIDNKPAYINRYVWTRTA